MAAKADQFQYCALFNERYQNFLKVELSDEEEARFQTEEAIGYYKAWGAEAKVQMLMETICTRRLPRMMSD